MEMPLIEKYRVRSFSEIKEQNIAIGELKNFFKDFPKKKAIILNGPPGSGKTSLAIALANEYDLEIMELNASDLRNRVKLEEVLKPAVIHNSLFKKGKIVLMDEVDGVTTTEEGGLKELIVLIDRTNYPIIITSNDIWQKKFSPLRQKCKIISLKKLSKKAIIEILEGVIKKEKKEIKKEILEIIAEKSKGDVRSALNDLQSIINLENKETTEIFDREKEESIFDVLKKLFQDFTNEKTLNLFDNINMEIDEIALWIEENIPLEYRDIALAKAYDALSKADLFKKRIYKQQYYRFLLYQNLFLTFGVSSAAKQKNKSFVQYKRPSRILKIWLSNQRNANKKSVIEKYARFCHMSKKKAIKESFFLPLIINKECKNVLDLDENEMNYLDEKKQEIISELARK